MINNFNTENWQDGCMNSGGGKSLVTDLHSFQTMQPVGPFGRKWLGNIIIIIFFSDMCCKEDARSASAIKLFFLQDFND